MTICLLLVVIVPLLLPFSALAIATYPGRQGELSGLEHPLGKIQRTVEEPETLNLEKLVIGETTVNPADPNAAEGIWSSLVAAAGFSILGAPYASTVQTPQGGQMQYYNRGAVGVAANLIDSLTDNPPVSTGEYIAYLGSNLGFAKPAYAQQQGTGWTALKPVMKAWQAFRNLAYLIFVLIFVIVGFMIMFRAKINPQTVISVEAAIPNLIVTLVLITFSYAIASLMIDLIYVGIYLATSIFSQYGIVGVDGAKAQIEEDLMKHNVITLVFTPVIWGQVGTSVVGSAAEAIGITVSSILWGPAEEGTITKFITGNLAYVIIGAAILFSMFKLFFQLLMSYIGIIFSVIFAPFMLVSNALPGSNSFINWIKNLLANVLVFPATAIIFMLAAALTNSTQWGAGEGIGFSQGEENIAAGLPLMTVPGLNAMVGLIGLGMILMAPKVVEMVKNALKVEKAPAYGAYALGQLLGVPGTVIGAPISTIMQYAQLQYYMGALRREPHAPLTLGAPEPMRPTH